MSATLPRRAFLGAELPGDHEAFTPAGVRIAGALPDSMAASAGLAVGDELVALAGLPVRDLCELARALRQAGAAATTELAFVRAGTRHTATVDVIAYPRETADYQALAVDGAILRVLVAGTGPRILIIQGIACESVDHPESPYAVLARAWTRAGYTTVRFDKRGVGDSTGGACAATDFATELADARAIAKRYQPDVIVGHSVGGIIAAQLAQHARGVIVYGTPVMPWIECLLDSARRQLALRDAPADEVAARLAAIRDLARTGQLNGRSAAYHAQLAELDQEAAWCAVTVPVLVARGEYDWVVAAADQARLASLARGELVDLPALDHLFGVHADRDASLRDYGAGAVDDRLVTATLPWLDRVVLKR